MIKIQTLISLTVLLWMMMKTMQMLSILMIQQKCVNVNKEKYSEDNCGKKCVWLHNSHNFQDSQGIYKYNKYMVSKILANQSYNKCVKTFMHKHIDSKQWQLTDNYLIILLTMGLEFYLMGKLMHNLIYNQLHSILINNLHFKISFRQIPLNKRSKYQNYLRYH